MTGVGIVPVFCIVPTCLRRSLYPKAIVTSFLYSVGYRAHGGAIVAVFVSGLGMHKTDAGTRQNATSKHNCFPDL